jgi:hypothetical protein
MARHRLRRAVVASPVLNRLIHAAHRAGEDGSGRAISGASDALREFGELARWVVPTQGVFVPNHDQVARVIERVAGQQFGAAAARSELRKALKAVEQFERREPIESAINQLRAASDEAHFYAGLSFGVIFSKPD